MRLPAIAVGLVCLLSATVQALEYPGTCRGPSAVVTSLSGVDSRFAVMTAKLSEVDATLFCKGEYSVLTTYQFRSRVVDGPTCGVMKAQS